MKSLTILFIFAVLFGAQSARKQFIINSGQYYYGEAVSEDVNEARDKALQQLTGQIAIHVAGSFQRVVHETGEKFTEDVHSILNTHSQATLRNVEQIVTRLPNGKMQVFCYLEKSKVAKIFEERKKLIAAICDKADEFAQENNLAYALKNYYFAAILLNSLPDENVVYNSVNYTTEIPHKINSILSNISFSFVGEKKVSDKEREITLKVTYRNNPVSLLDFKFWDGNNQIDVQARDGFATVRLVGASVKFTKLDLSVKYAYYECRTEYKVVDTLWDLVERPEFQANKTVLLQKIKKAPASLKKEKTLVKTAAAEEMGRAASEAIDPVLAKEIKNEAFKFVNILKSGDPEKARLAYAPDSFLESKISRYMRYNHPVPLDTALNGLMDKTRLGWELRHIRVLQTYPSIHKQSTEYLTLDFSNTGQFRDVNVSISDYLYQKFYRESEFGGDWYNRQEIIKFLEKYRTAYLTRDIQLVDKMFAEDALIIIGRRIERKKLPENAIHYQKLGKSQPNYTYIRLEKKEYLKRQEQVFKSQQDIFLDFSTFKIVKKNAVDSVYGVEMRQNYVSTTYADEGYLFLLVDFSGKNPLIYVRAWQPNQWKPDQLVRTANFKIYK